MEAMKDLLEIYHKRDAEAAKYTTEVWKKAEILCWKGPTEHQWGSSTYIVPAHRASNVLVEKNENVSAAK